ncbi:MAG: ABC transporter substrate-binding protein [Anaerolineae bacterium]|nr:ABC transporter substrate-binding protein [Anaerolineae bacterium]
MRKRILYLLTILLVSALILTGCRSAEEEEPTPEDTTEEEMPMEEEEEVEEEPAVRYCDDGLDGETITYYSQAGLTGPLSTILGTAFVNGLNDAIDEINAAGGVCGAEVVLALTDTQYDAEQEIAVYTQTRETDSGLFSIATYGSAATVALSPMVNEDHVVNIGAGLNTEATYIPRDGWTVLVAPIYSDQFAGFVQFVSENWADIKPEGAGDDIVVGVVGWEGPFGAGATTTESIAYAESQGVTVLPLETYAISAEADLVTPLQTLALGGANVIYIQSLGFGTAQAIGTLRALEMWDTVVVGAVNWGMNQDVLNVLGESATAMNGMYGMFPWEYWNDTDVPGVEQALAAFEGGGYDDIDKGVGYLTSYAGVYAWADIVELAINNVGFENLTGDAFFDAFKELGLVSGLGILEMDVRGETRSPRKSQVRQAQANAEGGVDFVVIEDFFELPDTRPPAE